jgi:biopolymer transport protein ExbB/TolQ
MHPRYFNLTMESTVDVRGLLENILGEQISRLLASKHIDKSEIDDLTRALKDSQLLPEQIEEDLAKELSSICNLRYESANAASHRLQGFGWSLQHMQEHMERVLKSKLEHLGTVLRTKKKIDISAPLSFKTAMQKHLELDI